MKQIIIGVRASQLALVQAKEVYSKLKALYPDIVFIIKKIKTTGDKFTTSSVATLGTTGIFTKEIEKALLEGKCDLAVHSAKDLPTQMPAGLKIAAALKREDPHDVLLLKENCKLKDLPPGTKIGTGSLRRRAQLLAYRPDLEIVPLRGNLETRLKKLNGQERGKKHNLEAIVVASAGLRRLGCYESSEFQYNLIPYSVMLPAAGQGAICIQIRKKDRGLENKLFKLNHVLTRQCIEAERTFLKELGGGCHVPVGVLARAEGGAKSQAKERNKTKTIRLKGMVLSPDGREIIQGQVNGPLSQPVSLGRELAKKLIHKGAKRLLSNTRCV